MRRFLTAFLVSALSAYVVFAVSGFFLTPQYDETATPDAVTFALDYAFPEAATQPASWTQPTGAISHRTLYRRASMRGVKDGRYTEQVLKVGFPFTIARGFIRTTPTEVHVLGAAFVSGDPTTGQATFLPLLPVWPGIVFFGLVGGLAALAHLRLTTR